MTPLDFGAVRGGQRVFLHLLAAAARQLGGRLEAEAAVGQLALYTCAAGRRRVIHGAALGLNSDAAARVAADKDYTARLLARDGLPVADGFLLLEGASQAEALAWARPRPGPLWIKPNGGHGGAGVRRVSDVDALGAALGPLRAAVGGHVLVQRHLEGRDYRVVVLKGEVLGAWERRPGAGRHTANLSTGGSAHDLRPCPEAAGLAARACAALGLRFAGVDLIAPDLARSARGAVVLEINSAPGLDAYAALGPGQRDRAQEILRRALEALERAPGGP